MNEHWNVERARAWRHFMPPARPSPGEVALYARFVEREARGGSPKCLLLGSTPELRSMIHARGYELVCVDRDRQVFETLTGMVECPGEELFIESDWMDMNFESSFDVILADGSMNMLDHSLHSGFLGNMHSALRPGGLVIQRCHLLALPVFRTPSAVFEWYRSTCGGKPIFTSTRTHLDMLWVDPKSGALDFTVFHQKIREMYYKGMISDEEHGAYAALLEFNRIILYYSRVSGFETQASKHFHIEGIYNGEDYACHEQHPVYLLRKQAVAPPISGARTS
jgi:hypothetical protein